MMPPKFPGYNGAVNGLWRWRGAAALILACACCIGLGAPARAAEQVGVGPNPWLDVQLQSGTLTVKTWDNPQVQVSTDGRVDIHHIDAASADPRIPRQYTAWSQNVSTNRGTVRLPEESFVLPKLPGNSHDEVVARGQGNTTVMIPRGTALVTAHVGTGQLNLNDYHGVFITHVGQGGINLNHVDGSGYVESLRGQVDAAYSSFDRLRVRTATGNMLFRGCTSHQIEASSTYGSIVYDNGKFQPGLAHFESEHGNVALGVRGGAQIGAQSGSGHVVSSFHSNTATGRANPNAAQETIRGGGPVVTAVSKSGSVYLYNGSVRNHPRVQSELQGVPTGATRSVQFTPQGTQFAPHSTPQRAPQQYSAPRYTAPRAPAPRFAPPPRYASPQYPPPGYAPRQGNPYAAPRQQRQQPQPQGQPSGADNRRHKPPN
ncbi:MAG: DUF4097 family beta strand repeat protein [Candidatus Eremiobacteraeota bacterium]|nr:DUF4097 family beta strand repeat protein [Candidatus Eremiobacteraeota bacterium]